MILAGGKGARLRALTCAVLRRAVRLDGLSLAANYIDQVENLGCIEPERRT